MELCVRIKIECVIAIVLFMQNKRVPCFAKAPWHLLSSNSPRFAVCLPSCWWKHYWDVLLRYHSRHIYCSGYSLQECLRVLCVCSFVCTRTCLHSLEVFRIKFMGCGIPVQSRCDTVLNDDDKYTQTRIKDGGSSLIARDPERCELDPNLSVSSTLLCFTPGSARLCFPVLTQHLSTHP